MDLSSHRPYQEHVVTPEAAEIARDVIMTAADEITALIPPPEGRSRAGRLALIAANTPKLSPEQIEEVEESYPGIIGIARSEVLERKKLMQVSLSSRFRLRRMF